jgi:hypothetical protein
MHNLPRPCNNVNSSAGVSINQVRIVALAPETGWEGAEKLDDGKAVVGFCGHEHVSGEEARGVLV